MKVLAKVKYIITENEKLKEELLSLTSEIEAILKERDYLKTKLDEYEGMLDEYKAIKELLGVEDEGDESLESTDSPSYDFNPLDIKDDEFSEISKIADEIEAKQNSLEDEITPEEVFNMLSEAEEEKEEEERGVDVTTIPVFNAILPIDTKEEDSNGSVSTDKEIDYTEEKDTLYYPLTLPTHISTPTTIAIKEVKEAKEVKVCDKALEKMGEGCEKKEELPLIVTNRAKARNIPRPPETLSLEDLKSLAEWHIDINRNTSVFQMVRAIREGRGEAYFTRNSVSCNDMKLALTKITELIESKSVDSAKEVLDFIYKKFPTLLERVFPTTKDGEVDIRVSSFSFLKEVFERAYKNHCPNHPTDTDTKNKDEDKKEDEAIEAEVVADRGVDGGVGGANLPNTHLSDEVIKRLESATNKEFSEFPAAANVRDLENEERAIEAVKWLELNRKQQFNLFLEANMAETIEDIRKDEGALVHMEIILNNRGLKVESRITEAKELDIEAKDLDVEAKELDVKEAKRLIKRMVKTSIYRSVYSKSEDEGLIGEAYKACRGIQSTIDIFEPDTTSNKEMSRKESRELWKEATNKLQVSVKKEILFKLGVSSSKELPLTDDTRILLKDIKAHVEHIRED